MVYISASLSFFLATRTYTHTHTLILAHILYSTHPYIIHPEFAGPSTNCHSALCLLYIPLVQQINTMYDTGICTEFLFSIYIYSVFLMFLSSISTRFSTTLLYFTESSIFTARKLLFVFSSLFFSSLLCYLLTQKGVVHTSRRAFCLTVRVPKAQSESESEFPYLYARVLPFSKIIFIYHILQFIRIAPELVHSDNSILFNVQTFLYLF